MRKSLILLVLQIMLIGFIIYQSRDLILIYYLLAPVVLLPAFYFHKTSSNILLGLALAGVAILNVHYIWVDPHLRLFVFWTIQAIFFGVLGSYFAELKRTCAFATEKKNGVRQNLENLQTKFQTRVSSLKHLELQVGSLMNLFEIARDFSECMDFTSLSDFLLKKLRNELSFQKMMIFILPVTEAQKNEKNVKVYEMTQQGAKEIERELTADEQHDFEALVASKNMVRRDRVWHFPIFEGDVLSSVFSVEGVKDDDLARVEVLSAYLVLLIKKIRLYETVRELAIIDELTQVFVRQHFTERLEEEVRRSIRFSLPLAVLMLDIDHFKRYNDEFGHLVGDATLKEVSDLLKKNLRRVDLVGRYGGEEFVVAMPETKIENAIEVAERIRSNIARHDFQVYNDKTKVTVSQGIEVFAVPAVKDPEKMNIAQIVSALIRHADAAMYRAKDEGRNRVCIYKGSKNIS